MFDGYKTRNWIYLLLPGRETTTEHRKISNYTSQNGLQNLFNPGSFSSQLQNFFSNPQVTINY